MYWPVLAFFLAGLSLETFLDPGFNVRFLAPAIPLLLILTVEMARYTVAFAVPRKIGIWLVNSALLGSLLTIIVGVVYFRVGGPHDRNRCDFFAVNREMVTKALDAVPGDHLVLVHYSDPGTPYMRQEWVYNSDDIDSQRIVWAHELEPEVTDAPLICHFSTRHIWLFSPYPAGFPDPGVIIKYSSSEEALSHLMPVSVHGVCAALNSQVILSK